MAWEKVDPALKAMFVRLGVRLRVPNAPEDGAEDSGLVSGGGGATHASDSDFGEETIDDDTTLSEKATQLPSTSSQNVMVGKIGCEKSIILYLTGHRKLHQY